MTVTLYRVYVARGALGSRARGSCARASRASGSCYVLGPYNTVDPHCGRVQMNWRMTQMMKRDNLGLKPELAKN